MNSIEIAKKLIVENDVNIEVLRSGEKAIRQRIEGYKADITSLRHAIELAEEDLQRKKDLKKEFLVDNLALKAFIADGGGLDVLD